MDSCQFSVRLSKVPGGEWKRDSRTWAVDVARRAFTGMAFRCYRGRRCMIGGLYAFEGLEKWIEFGCLGGNVND